MLAQNEGRSKFRGLQEGEKLNQSLVNKYFVQIYQWGQAVQQIFKRQRMGIWNVCVWSCHRSMRGTYVSLI